MVVQFVRRIATILRRIADVLDEWCNVLWFDAGKPYQSVCGCEKPCGAMLRGRTCVPPGWSDHV